MRNFSIVILFCLCLFGTAASSNEQVLSTFTGNYPADVLEVGQLNAGSYISVVMTCQEPFADSGIGYLSILNGPSISNVRSVLVGTPIDLHTTTIVNYRILNTGMYWLYAISRNYYNKCSFKIQIDRTVKIVPMVISLFNNNPVSRISVVNSCRVKIKYSGLALAGFRVFDIKAIGADPVIQSTSNPAIVNLSSGDYLFVMDPDPQVMPQLKSVIPYTLMITTFCDNLCVVPGMTPLSCSTYCGDGILDQGEQCDNGNKAGCQNCFISNGYSCFGNIGGTSICGKQTLCGDGVFDKGEECDNKHQLGCSAGCKIDAGYNCTSSLGYPSVCGLCGNGIVERDEQCDNKNQLGCSVGCKVDPGFTCRGLITSACFSRNPLCGNGIWEVAESCDDGNKLVGDGCGPTCLIEPGFTCSGEPSKCTKKLTICGNGIVQTDNNEQCDNGNKQGCVGCVVQLGWECINLSGFPSKCSPKVIIPNCGNGVLEPEKAQNCDDGNLVNGDGCSYFCKVEPEWVCPDGKKCIKANDPNQLKVLCGNGKVEGAAQVCDDGNSVNGDGCSSECIVENGWDCQVYTQIGTISYCRKLANGSSFCGDGVVQGTEECDDGFPLVNGDGCSIGCYIQSGWTCERIPNILISRCSKI